jgi:hypothetical protein
MKRRDFLQRTTIGAAALLSTFGASAYAASDAAVPGIVPKQKPIETSAIDSNLTFSIVSGPTQSSVDAEFKALVERRVNNGKTISVYADQALSNQISALENMNETLWVARNDKFDWIEQDHPIHQNVELRFWARLRDDPETVAVQKFSDGLQFLRGGKPHETHDVLSEAFLTGHNVITGIVASDYETATRLFMNSMIDYYYRDDLDKLRLVYDGVDRSREFQSALRSVWS